MAPKVYDSRWGVEWFLAMFGYKRLTALHASGRSMAAVLIVMFFLATVLIGSPGFLKFFLEEHGAVLIH